VNFQLLFLVNFLSEEINS